MHRPSMVPLPFLLTLLASLANAQQHGRFDGNRSAGTAAFPSPLFEGRTASAGNGGPPPPRRPPSFSPFTPFLSPQSLPRPLSAGRMPRRRLDMEDGRRTSSANNSLEGGGTGRAENGERWRGGRGMMNEQRQRVVDASSPSGGMGLSRMATPTNSSSPAAGGDPTVPFPLPPKGPFDGGARKEGRPELLVEKEDKTDLERVKKDGDDDGQGRKRGGEQFPPDDGVLKKSAEEERFRTPPQSVPPLAGRFAPTRTTPNGAMGMKAADDRTSGEFKNDQHGVRGGEKGGERSEERVANRGRTAEMEIGGTGERENSAEWRRGSARGGGGGGGAIGGNGGGRNEEDGEEEEGGREAGDGRSRNGKGGGGRTAESLLFSPLQGPFPDSPGGRSAAIGRDGRRGEEVEERRNGEEGMGDRRGERRGDEREGRGRVAEERRRKAPSSSSESEDRRRPLAGPRHVPPPPAAAHHSHRTPPSASSSTEERSSRESADGRQHPHNAQRRPAGIPSRTARPPVAAVTLGFQRGIPNPNEFFPDQIRSAYPPFPKPFEEFDGKQRNGRGREGGEGGRERGGGRGGEGREGGGGKGVREGGGDGREGGGDEREGGEGRGGGEGEGRGGGGGGGRGGREDKR